MSNLISQTSLQSASLDLLQTLPCDISVYIGAWVYLDATGTLQNAIATSAVTSNVVGVVENKPDTTIAVVRLLGASKAVFTGLTIGSAYFLSTVVAGEMTTSVPSAAGDYILNLGQALSTTKFRVQPQLRIRRAL